MMIPFLISLVLFQWVEGHSTSPNEFIKHLICYSCVLLRAPQFRCYMKIMPATKFEKSESQNLKG